MKPYKFYLIISKKSEEIVNGLKKITFGCENRADAHGFLWIDSEDNISQIQLIFGEIVLEWISGKWVKFSMTNRTFVAVEEAEESNQGAHILHPLENTSLNDEVMRDAKNAVYPLEWAEKIMERF